MDIFNVSTVQRRLNFGWTLIELLSTTTIIALVVGAGLPTMNNWIQKSAQRTTFNNLHHLIYFARSEAVKKQKYITLCPTIDHIHCSKRWDNIDVMVFTDINKNERIDASTDQLLRISQVARQIHCLELRASARKQYLQFKPTGASNGIAGHFRFCETDHTLLPWKMVISLNGRSRLKAL